jgi:hypothetical protein
MWFDLIEIEKKIAPWCPYVKKESDKHNGGEP